MSANLSIRYWENTTDKVCKKCGSKIQQKTWFEDFDDEETRVKLYRCSNHKCSNHSVKECDIKKIANTLKFEEKRQKGLEKYIKNRKNIKKNTKNIKK